MVINKLYPPGFAPVNFQIVGKVLFFLWVIITLINGLGYLTGWLEIPRDVFFIGLTLLAVSVYLIFVVPKKE